jgi:hypothetical protein
MVNNDYVDHFTKWDTPFLYVFGWDYLGNKDIYQRMEGFIKEFRKQYEYKEQ